MSEESVPDGYKKTEIGVIPEEWDVCKFKEYLDIKSGKGFKLSEYSETGIRLLRIDNVTYGKIKWDTIAYLPEDYLTDYSDLVLKEGDILLALNRPITQNRLKIGILKKEDVPSILYQRVGKIVFTQKINPIYVYYWLSTYLPPFISKKAVGSDQPFINITDLRNLLFIVPNQNEQQKIASILSKVDEQISFTESIIEKTEELKKGLMQQLLTRGIGHTKFKKTEIGEIPEEWNYLKLEECCTRITDGSHLSPKNVDYSGYKIATIANMDGNKFDIESCKNISKEEYDKLFSNGCKPAIGDILFSKDGTVGLCFVHKQDSNLVLLSSIAIISPNNEILDSNYGAQSLKSDLILNHIIGRKTGTAIRRIVLRDLKSVKIPIPPLSEQQQIASIISKVDEQITDNKNYLSYLKELKQGLMQDLLTGKVRVKVS
ncbi:type I restriction-modification system, S subunit [Methanolobus psychrophilus R15]|nr:type I restriction-modification system, S subunit [Methanolobus psychrophilus R15]